MLRQSQARLCSTASSSNRSSHNSFFHRLHERLAARVPDIGHTTTARVKWATYTYWYLLDPILRRHHRYYRRKVALDRFLEKNSTLTNTVIGVVLGLTVYLLLSEWILPPSAHQRVSILEEEEGEDRKGPTLQQQLLHRESSPQEDAEVIVQCIGTSASKELPAFQLMRLKRLIIGRLLEVADLAELQQQREEAEKLKRTLAMLGEGNKQGA